MDTVEVLTKARAIIEPPEMWTKGPDVGPNGELCVVRAVEAACGLKPGFLAWARSDEAGDALSILNTITPNNLACAEYNDAPETTHADILALFDRAIQRAVKSKAGA